MAGSTTSVHSSTFVIPIMRRAPIPEMARWLASVRLPNPAIVVTALYRIARPVAVSSRGAPAPLCFRLCTMWIPASTPSPRSSGSVMTFEMLNGMSHTTAAAPVSR